MSSEMATDRPDVEQLVEYFELLRTTLHELGKGARTLVAFDEDGGDIKKVTSKTFLLPGALTEWVPSDRSNLPSGLAIKRERQLAAVLFQLAGGSHKLVVNEKDSLLHQRPKEAGEGNEYHTKQLRSRFAWDADGVVTLAQMHPVDMYSDATLRGWSMQNAIEKSLKGAYEPFRFDHGWQPAGAGDVDHMLYRTDEFRRELIEQRASDAM